MVGERRRRVAQSVLGLLSDQPISALKAMLTDAGLLAPGDTLDTVIVQDLDHFFELLGDQGIPLMRTDYFPVEPMPPTTSLSGRRKWLLAFRRQRRLSQ